MENVHWRNYLIVGRDVFHKHPDDFNEDEWEQADEFVALRLVEQDEAAEQQAAMGGPGL